MRMATRLMFRNQNDGPTTTMGRITYLVILVCCSVVGADIFRLDDKGQPFVDLQLRGASAVDEWWGTVSDQYAQQLGNNGLRDYRTPSYSDTVITPFDKDGFASSITRGLFTDRACMCTVSACSCGDVPRW